MKYEITGAQGFKLSKPDAASALTAVTAAVKAELDPIEIRGPRGAMTLAELQAHADAERKRDAIDKALADAPPAYGVYVGHELFGLFLELEWMTPSSTNPSEASYRGTRRIVISNAVDLMDFDIDMIPRQR